MLHLPELMYEQDAMTAQMIAAQLKDPRDPRYGGVVREDFGYHVEPRMSGFILSDLVISYLCQESTYYHSDEARRAIEATLVYMRRHQRPDGCFDLSGCNFSSPPDTSFMMNAVLNAWWLLEKRGTPETEWLKEPILAFITSCARGVAAGGFHTPNHRWAIAAFLKHASNITGDGAFSARADEYLNEGLDINEDGEFAERSAGNYNQVNDDQMIRLYLATGEERFLIAARDNLRMMLRYIDPDDSVFTNNSTRQDYGRKVYLDSYYILFLTVGYLLRDKQMGAMAEYCYQSARKHGCAPRGAAWLLLMPEMDGFGADGEPPYAQFKAYNQFFPASRIARMRRGDMSFTLMMDKANFLYFQHGAMTVYMVIYANLCDKRNFIADAMTPVQDGYKLTSRAESWYYLPLYPETPETSDWWAMDNPNKRKRTTGVPLYTEVTARLTEHGADVHIRTEGIDQLPLRVEIGLSAPCNLRHEGFVMKGKPGESLFLRAGTLEATGADVSAITLGPGFAQHALEARSGGAYPQSDQHFTVYMSAYTPVDQTIHIGAHALEKPDLLPWEEAAAHEG